METIESRAWQTIIDGLDKEPRRLLKRFIVTAMRRETPVPSLWLYGPAASHRSAMVKALSTALGAGSESVIVISNYDLGRGGLALTPIYRYVAINGSLGCLLIIKAGRLSRGFWALQSELNALVSGQAIFVKAKNHKSLEWKLDLPLLFVADVPPPELLAERVSVVELAAVTRTKKQVSPKVFNAVMSRAIRTWAMSREG